MSPAEQIAAAEKRFEDFHGHPPAQGDIITLDGLPNGVPCFIVGEAYGIMYKTHDVKEPYLHKFNATARPLLVVTFDGSQAFMLKGAYRFTDRGFIG